jgi:hypothetical protein
MLKWILWQYQTEEIQVFQVQISALEVLRIKEDLSLVKVEERKSENTGKKRREEQVKSMWDMNAEKI